MSYIDEWYRQLDRIGGAHHLIVRARWGGSCLGVTDVEWHKRTPTWSISADRRAPRLQENGPMQGAEGGECFGKSRSSSVGSNVVTFNGRRTFDAGVNTMLGFARASGQFACIRSTASARRLDAARMS